MSFSKVLWWGLVAAIWIKNYCYFVEKWETFSIDAVQKAGGKQQLEVFL